MLLWLGEGHAALRFSLAQRGVGFHFYCGRKGPWRMPMKLRDQALAKSGSKAGAKRVALAASSAPKRMSSSKKSAPKKSAAAKKGAPAKKPAAKKAAPPKKPAAKSPIAAAKPTPAPAAPRLATPL